MSQYPGAIEHGAPPRMSGLAVTALVSTLIFCCPVTTVIGVLLGLVALASISANPAKKGRGVAITAILIGVLATAGQTWVTVKFGVPSVQLLMNGPGPALTAGFGGDTAGFRTEFHGPGASATDADVTAFIDELRSRYGEFKSSRQLGQNQPPLGATTFPSDYELVFSNTTVSADAELIFTDPATGAFVCKLGWITVHDTQRGDLTFPPGP